ncbi:MAG: inositol monophosphatase family protein [Anaerolineales bacterium]
MLPHTTLQDVASQAARAGGKALLDRQFQQRDITSKGHLDIVTDADFAADAAIQQTIHHHFPEHTILSEESDAAAHIDTWRPPEDTYTWIIDPLDGTNNYARGNPSWSVSVAVARGGQILAGAVYDATRDHLFFASQGGGAWLNEKRLQVRATELEWAALAADWPTHPPYRRMQWDMLDQLMPEVRTLRCWGTTALALAHIAAGYLDVYLNRGFKIWDVAAGILLVQEAAGQVTRLDGSAWALHQRDLLATNGYLHSTIQERIAPVVADHELPG